MGSTYYSAVWTDSGFFLGCTHEHQTIVEADSCIPCAGGYVVGVANGATCSLTAEEEAEFQRVHYAPRNDKPPLGAILAAPAEAAISDCIPPRGEGETFVEFVLRFLSAHSVAPHAEPIPIVKHSAINIDMIDLVLSRLGESEASEFARMYIEDKHALLDALGNRFRTLHTPTAGGTCSQPSGW